MKALVPALLILTASACFSQGLPGEGTDPSLLPPPDSGTAQPRVFQLPQNAPVFPGPFARIRPPKLTNRTPALDPGFLLRPPGGSFAQQTPRPPTPEAQRLYPGLKLLPLAQEVARSEAIPILWPDAEVEPIPTTWDRARVSPAGENPAHASGSPDPHRR